MKPTRSQPPSAPTQLKPAPATEPAAPRRPATARPAVAAPVAASPEIPLGMAIASSAGDGGTVTARKAGGLRDMVMEVNPRKVGVKAALQHLAKAVNIAFQTDFGENYLESVYQAAIVRRARGPHHPQRILRVRRHLVWPVRTLDPLCCN
jgi:hypothetical protein